MRLKTVVEELPLYWLTAEKTGDREVTGGYTGDLLSDVMANSREGNIWITLQTHQNIVAVAKLKELAGIILVNDRKPDKETQAKADAEGVTLLLAKDSAFVISGKLYALLNRNE
jgi:hypothetical protein